MLLGLSLLLALLLLGAIIWRRQLLALWQWRQSLRRQIKQLQAAVDHAATPQHQRANAVIYAKIKEIQGQIEPSLAPLQALPGFCREVARVYYPQAKDPLTEARIGDAVEAAQRALDRLDQILRQPGVDLLRRVRIHQVRRASRRYQQLRNHWLGRLYIRYQRWLTRFSRLRLLLFPDLVSLVLFSSQHLTLLLLTRFFLLDVYLFVGRMVMATLGRHTNDTTAAATDFPSVEELETLLGDMAEEPHDPYIQTLREHLTGWRRLAVSTPEFSEARQTLWAMTEHVAKREFPDSPYPMEEATLEVIVIHLRSWLAHIADGQQRPVIKRIYTVRISWLVQGRRWLEQIPTDAQQAVGQAYRAWRASRQTRKTSPLGWLRQGATVAAQRLLLRWLFKRLFDLTYREISRIYRASKHVQLAPPDKQSNA